jgi:hypothetical protein
MKDHYTLQLSKHQAKGLNAALAMVNQFLAMPEGAAVYPNLPTKGVEGPLVVSELKLLYDDIVCQFEEQDKT